MNVVWINPSITLAHNGELARDDVYGVDSDLVDLVGFTDTYGNLHQFLVSGTDENSYDWYVAHLKQFISALDPDWADKGHSTIMGDFWPDGVGVGDGYDVHMLEYQSGTETITVFRLDPEPREF